MPCSNLTDKNTNLTVKNSWIISLTAMGGGYRIVATRLFYVQAQLTHFPL